MKKAFDFELPRELRDKFDPVSVLGERDGCRTALLRGRDGGLAVLKKVGEGFDGRVYEAVRALEGEGVARMLGIYRTGDGTYLLREYVEGRTLLEAYREGGPFSTREAAGIGAKICETLRRLHGMDPPLIHRDIKAENVVLTPEGRCVLIDFDIARIYDESDERDTRVMGTGFASAPEQFGYAQTDPRSDIYSLGVLLYEISTGEFSLSRGKLKGKLGRVVAKCTRFDPADRYQSAAELKRALSGAGRRRWPVAAMLAAALAACCLGAILLPKEEEVPKEEAVPEDAVPEEAVLEEDAEPEETVPEGEIYVFASPEIGREAARQLGKSVDEITREDLQRITAIHLVGERSFDFWEEMLIHGEEITLKERFYPDMERGSVDTLEDIPNFPNLTELAICNQQISDLTPLWGLPLERLALHGNSVTDLAPLGRSGMLQQLIISDNPVTDLGPLEGISRLWGINIGATQIEDLDSLKNMPGLTSLEIHDCPGITSFEDVGELEGLTFLSVRPLCLADMEAVGRLTGLTSLYIWSPDCPKDLEALKGLVNLEILYLDIHGLESLEGIEGMSKLWRLNFMGDMEKTIDAAPLAGLTALEDVNFDFLHSTTNWSEVTGLVNLRFATISPSDEKAFRAALNGREVVINVSLK